MKSLDASRWLTDDQTERLAPHLAGTDELLLVTARQSSGRRLGLGGAHVVLFHAPPRRIRVYNAWTRWLSLVISTS